MAITTQEFALQVTDLLEDHGVDVTDEAGFATSLAALFISWTDEGSAGFPTPALALRVATLLANWNANQVQFRTWWVGEADGGWDQTGTVPGGGHYMLTDGLGNVRYLPSPAKMLTDLARGYSALELLVAAEILPEGTTDAEFATWLRAPAVDAVASLQAGWTAALDAAQVAQGLADDALAAAAAVQGIADAAVEAAQLSETNAAASEDAAAQSATQAAQSLANIGTAQADTEAARDEAVQARNTAQGHAQAAALSELNAGLSEDAAALSESAAAASAGAADTSEGLASTAATNAAASEEDAEDAALAAELSAAVTFPERLNRGTWWTDQPGGDYASAPPVSPIVLEGGFLGFRKQGRMLVYSRTLLAAVSGTVYEVEAELQTVNRQTAGHRSRTIVEALDADFNVIGTAPGSTTTTNSNGTAYTLRRRFSNTTSNSGASAWPAGAVWLRFGIETNIDSAFADLPNAIAHLRRLTIRDVTSRRFAESAQTAAAASATAAALSETNAANSALDADQSETEAEAARDLALGAQLGAEAARDEAETAAGQVDGPLIDARLLALEERQVGFEIVVGAAVEGANVIAMPIAGVTLDRLMVFINGVQDKSAAVVVGQTVTVQAEAGDHLAVVLPGGVAGRDGENLSPDASGLKADRGDHDAAAAGFLYQANDTLELSAKLSPAPGDWGPWVAITAGPPGLPGSDAAVTAGNIAAALGFAPPQLTSTAPSDLRKHMTALAGAAGEAARADHAHAFPAATGRVMNGPGALAITDHGTVVTWDAANGAMTLPADLPAGFNCMVEVAHATGLPTFTAAAGATIRQADTLNKPRKQWSEVSLRVRANDGGAAAEWVLSGDMA